MANRTYTERLAITGLESLELRRLRYDLICTYKILSNTFLPHHAAAPGLMDGPIDMVSLPLIHLPTQEVIPINVKCQMSKTFIGGAVCREFESEAPAAEEMLD